MADNLIQRGGLWHVRLDIPKDVRAAFGNRRILSQSLRTGSRSDAMRLRLPILAEWKAEIQAVREHKQASAHEWRSIQHAEGLEVLSRRKDVVQRLYTPATSQEEKKPFDLSFINDIPKLYSELMEAGKPELAQRLVAWANSYLDSLEKGMTHGIGIGLQNELINIIAEINIAATADEYSLSAEEEQEAREITFNPSIYKIKSPITKGMTDAWASHLETQIKAPKTRDMHVNRMQKFSNFLTSEGLPLNFDSVHKFLDSLPPASKTRANYLWSGRTFWKWANKYNQVFRDQFSQSPCPFDGHELPKQGKAAGQSYVPFTRAEVERLHAQALSKGDTDLSNLIALGAYTGARLEELGRIKSEDAILDAKGQPIGFTIKEAKTAAGVREVPLHPAIAPLFAQLTEQAPANDGYLFKGGNNKYGNRLDGLSKKFGRLKLKMGYSELHVFHSIRKTTTTELHQRGVTMEILPYIIGHETKAFTLDVYSAGPSFEQKREAVCKLEFSFTLPPC